MTITIDFTAETIVSDYCLGRIGEHNATELVIMPPAELTDDERTAFFIVQFGTNGKIIKSGIHSETPFTIALWQQLTLAPRMSIQIVAYDADGAYIGKSEKLSGFFFMPSLTGVETVKDDDVDKLVNEIGKNSAARHTHQNKETLDKFGESEGVPTFNGEEISGASTWDEIEDKPTTLAGYGIDEEVDEVISDYTYSKEESNAEIKKAIELVELCRTGWQESLYTPAEIKSTLKGKHLMWNGNPVIATSFVIVPGIGECAYVLIAVVVADDETTRNAHLTIGGVKVFPNKSASNLTMTKVLSDENFTSEFKDLLTNLGAEDVAYDDSETYSDGTVGKEITSLKSDITEKLDANLGATEAGKFLKIDTDGSIIPTNLPLYQGGVE